MNLRAPAGPVEQLEPRTLFGLGSTTLTGFVDSKTIHRIDIDGGGSLTRLVFANVQMSFDLSGTNIQEQQIGTVDKYVNGLKQVFGGGQFQITGCQPQINTYAVTPQGDDASVSGAFDIKVTTDAGALTVQVPFKIAFAKIAGAWKISDLEVVQSQG